MFALSFLARPPLPAALLAVSLAIAAPVVQSNPDSYEVTNLVSDLAGVATANPPDPDLRNPWGIAFNPNGVVWVADNLTGKSTLYDGNGVKQGLVVTISAIAGGGPGSPTGIVFNGTNDFRITTSPGGTPVVAAFIFVSEDGAVSAWAPGITTAVLAASNPDAHYTGVAIAGNGSVNRLYAADFPGGKIDVYSNTFAFQVGGVPGNFADPSIPAGYGPFNIVNIQGNLYVAYAKVGEEGDEVSGRGLGYVRVFDADGHLLKRLIDQGQLNAPWGMALAPAGFGRFSNRLLIGNFGDGIINAYDVANGHFAGSLRTNATGRPEGIEGLWGIGFGNGVRNQPTNTLFFAAGIDDEEHGLYGRIDAVADGD